MCYERTKIKFCHKCFSTFLVPSASFLQPSLISTLTFHLRIAIRVFPSTHYYPRISIYTLLSAYFHLHITIRVFPSTHYYPRISIYALVSAYFRLLITDLRKLSNMYHGCVYLWSKLIACQNIHAASYYIHYIHDTQEVSNYVLLLHNTKSGMKLRLTVQCQLNKKHL